MQQPQKKHHLEFSSWVGGFEQKRRGLATDLWENVCEMLHKLSEMFQFEQSILGRKFFSDGMQRSDGTGLNRTRTVSPRNTAENKPFFTTKFNRFCSRSSSGGQYDRYTDFAADRSNCNVCKCAAFVKIILKILDRYIITFFKSGEHLAHTLTNVYLLKNTRWHIILTLKHLISFYIYSNPFIPHVHLGKSWQKM